MRRFVPALLAAAGLALGALPTGAAPFTTHFDPLVSEMVGRLASIPDTGLTQDQRRQRSALNRAFRAEEVASVDLAGDLAMARKMVGALEKAFPGDAILGGLYAGLNDGLAADVDVQRDEAVVLISIAMAGSVRTRAVAWLAAADALFIAADEAPTQALRARTRQRGYRAVVQAAALAVRAGPDGSTAACPGRPRRSRSPSPAPTRTSSPASTRRAPRRASTPRPPGTWRTRTGTSPRRSPRGGPSRSPP